MLLRLLIVTALLQPLLAAKKTEDPRECEGTCFSSKACGLPLAGGAAATETRQELC